MLRDSGIVVTAVESRFGILVPERIVFDCTRI